MAVRRAAEPSRLPRAEGFPGQRIVVLPRPVVERALTHPLLRGLLPTDVGYFPKAEGHQFARPIGVDQAIFIYCVKGGGWCELSGRRHAIRSGDLLVVPPGLPHVYGADAGQPWTIHWFHATGANMGCFLAELGLTAERPMLYLGEDPQLLGLFEEVLGAVEHGYTPAQLLYASQALAHLLGAMVRRRHENWRDEPDPDQKVSQSIAYMKEHLDSPLQVHALAALANLSPSHYTAIFKRQTGYAPFDYFIRLRMHRACQLLDTSELNVKTIATLVGYEDPLYFSRAFKQVNEISPSEYRLTRKG